MGRHFDALVEFASKHLHENETTQLGLPPGANKDMEPRIRDVKRHLEGIVERAALFDFPIGADEIHPQSNKDEAELRAYMRDYFDMSEEYGSFFLTPFKLTAVEDPTSVTVLSEWGHGEYIVTSCCSRTMEIRVGKGIGDVLWELSGQTTGNKLKEGVVVYYGHITVQKPLHENGHYPIAIRPLFLGLAEDGRRVSDHSTNLRHRPNFNVFARAISEDAIAYFEEVGYIMDPENFIIRKEGGDSRAQRARKRRKSGKKRKQKQRLRKTVMRPHYIILSEDDTRLFLSSQSKIPKAAHPVRGHWRHLMSPRFVHKCGQMIYIKQYFTGQGNVEGKEGWHYQIMVKEAPDRVVAYKG